MRKPQFVLPAAAAAFTALMLALPATASADNHVTVSPADSHIDVWPADNHVTGSLDQWPFDNWPKDVYPKDNGPTDNWPI